MAITIKIDKSVVGNTFRVQHSLVEITQSDIDLMDAFGDVKVDFGGAFTGFTLPTNERSLRSGLPVLNIFDKNAEPSAETYANTYVAEIDTRITAAMATLRLNSDGFSGSSDTEY